MCALVMGLLPWSSVFLGEGHGTNCREMRWAEFSSTQCRTREGHREGNDEHGAGVNSICVHSPQTAHEPPGCSSDLLLARRMRP